MRRSGDSGQSEANVDQIHGTVFDRWTSAGQTAAHLLELGQQAEVARDDSHRELPATIVTSVRLGGARLERGRRRGRAGLGGRAVSNAVTACDGRANAQSASAQRVVSATARRAPLRVTRESDRPVRSRRQAPSAVGKLFAIRAKGRTRRRARRRGEAEGNESRAARAVSATVWQL